MRSWVITTILNWPTRRGCPPNESPPNSTPTPAWPISPSISIGSIPRSSTRGCSRSRGHFIDSRTTGSRPGTSGNSSSERTIEHDGEAWDREVWKASKLEAVFLTNEFDDSLDGWDTAAYVPCLRTDDLVLKLNDPMTIPRLRLTTDIDVEDYASLRLAIGRVFERFVRAGARACAISLPPDFAPRRASPRRAATPIRKAIHGMELRPDEQEEVRCAVFWMLAEFCAEFRLPFDLMIGPVRNIYPGGVAGGRDLFDRRVSLYEYRELFNHFASVTFPVSTLAPDAAAELVAYAWIFPNVLPMGHWWYANVPAFIATDLRAQAPGLAQGQASRILFRCVQARIHRAQVQHVPSDSGGRSRGGRDSRPRLVGRSGVATGKTHPD